MSLWQEFVTLYFLNEKLRVQFLLGFQGNPEGPIAGTIVQSQRAVQEENNELLSENLDRRRQQLFRQDMGSRLKSKIYTSAIAA